MLLKITRILRGASWAADARKLVNTTLLALPALMNVAGLMLLMYFVYAVLGVALFFNASYQEYITDHANFQDFATSFVTLFRITTGESWNGVMHDLIRGKCLHADDRFKNECGGPVQAYLYMYSFMFFGCLIVFNLFVAVILDNMATVDVEGDHPLCPHKFARVWACFDPFSHDLLPVGQVRS